MHYENARGLVFLGIKFYSMTIQDSCPKWYYDACTLDKSKSEYAEMFNSKYKIQPVISHLAFGEAFANSYIKGKENLDAFVLLMEKLRPFIKVVQNDGYRGILENIKESFPSLSNTDAMHLATALENGCVCIKTIDPDFCGLNRKKLSELGAKYDIPDFFINKK